ncbi:MAG: iron ABC transporter permease [Rhodospirillales bacterium]|nr:iron ABC transporter permease [Rhodospirillales bacterium]
MEQAAAPLTFAEAGRTASGRRRPRRLLLAAAAAGPLLVVLPLGEMLLEAARVDPAQLLRLLWRPLVGELLLNTIGLLVAATASAALIGTAAAWLVERTELPGRRFFAVAAAVPLAIPPFISSYAWLSLSPALEGFAGAWIVITSSYYPLVYLPVAASLRGIDPAIEETARSLGEGAAGAFFRAVLPQLRPALLGGILLVALNVLVEFGAFALLRFRTFTTELYAEYRTGFDRPAEAVLALVLLFFCLLCLIAEIRVRGRASYARIGAGVRRPITPLALGRARPAVFAGFVALIFATLGLPLGMILYWLTRHGAAAVSPAAVSASALLEATLSSVGLGLGGAALTVILALPLGLLAARYQGSLVTLFERAAFLGQGVPGIVVALALITITIRTVRPLYQTAATLVVAYAILFLPLALVSVRAAFMQAERRLEEVGHSLGLGWPGVAWRIALPLAAPGLGAAAALVFVSIVTELTATLLLAPIGTNTLAVQVWADTSTLAFAAAAPYAATMVVISLLATWLLARRFGATRLFQR